MSTLVGKPSGYQPNVDGWVLPDVPLAAVSAGKHNHVPLIVGADRDETGASVGQMTETAYEAAVLALAGGAQSVADEILAEYPSASYGSPRAAYVAATSDLGFVCPARTVARAARMGQTQPVYRYLFTHVADNAPAALKALGAFHGSELHYVFDHLDVLGYVPSAGETALAAAIDGYWSRLGAAGDPNGQGAVTWPRLRRDEGLVPPARRRHRRRRGRAHPGVRFLGRARRVLTVAPRKGRR